ncbi:MAG: lamin tail domain-containing protein [Phycisphaerales bacterium]
MKTPIRIAGLCLLTAAATSTSASPIPHPHPIITEVLFDVPPGAAGDASSDGAREANGDEFVELFNPHPKPINLKGYRIVNRLAAGDLNAAKGFLFVFPDCELPPGGIVVLFNGQNSKVNGPIGTSVAAPPQPNPNFNNALVFVAKAGKSKPTGFKNDADCTVLETPDARAVDVVVWGAPDPPAPTPADGGRTESVKSKPKGSVQRLTAEAALQPHIAIDGKPFSPGVMPAFKSPQDTPAPPSGKPAEKPAKTDEKPTR